MRTFFRTLCCLALVALFATACGGSAAIVASENANETVVDDSSNAEGASEADEPAADSPAAVEPTAAPAPTATSVPADDETSEAADDAVEAPNDSDADDANDADDENRSFAPSTRQEALDMIIEEGFTSSDAECLVDGAYEVFGVWDFLDAEPDPAQDAELELLIDECVQTVPGPAAGSPPPGTNAELDVLWVACDAGDADACDDLYFDSPLDSDYEAFGLTCGGRAIASCPELLGDGDGDSSDSEQVDGPAAGSPPPGDDAELDALWVACDGGSADACDDLFWSSPSDSDYEAFGLSCGGRAVTFCSEILDD